MALSRGGGVANGGGGGGDDGDGSGGGTAGLDEEAFESTQLDSV